MAVLRALTCGDSHSWHRDYYWDPVAGSWMANAWTCLVCRLTDERP